MVGEIKKAKDEAAARGEKQFFAGVPCRPHKHVANRFTSSGACVVCDRMKYHANSKARILQMKEWRAKNPQAVKDGQKRWKDANPDACRELSYNRKRRVRNAGPGFTATQVDAMYEAQGRRCAGCLSKIKKYHVDHIEPIARGGLHDISNIQILCAPCNHKKHKKDPIRWANENGRLL